MSTLTCGPEGKIYGSSYINQHFFRYDPATGKILAKATASGAVEQLALAIGGGSVWIAEATGIRQVPLALLR